MAKCFSSCLAILFYFMEIVITVLKRLANYLKWQILLENSTNDRQLHNYFNCIKYINLIIYIKIAPNVIMYEVMNSKISMMITEQ